MIYLKIILAFLFPMMNENNNEVKVENESRQNITFILGEDTEGSNKYYAQALDYYSGDTSSARGQLVENVRTYQGVLDYLNEYSTCMPWGEINLVVHANPWTGMSLAFDEGGDRVQSMVLLEKLMEDKVHILDVDVVDHETAVFVHGCALGMDEALADLMAITLGGLDKKRQPQVHISKKFTGYYSHYFDELYQTEKYESTPYFTFYKKGYKLGDIRLSRKLNKRYPVAKVNWREALKRGEPRWKGDSYYTTFNIPIEWIVTYESITERDGKLASNEKEILKWIDTQDDLVNELNDMGINVEDFLWEVSRVNHEYPDGSIEPAIKLKGVTTVLCVLEYVECERTLKTK